MVLFSVPHVSILISNISILISKMIKLKNIFAIGTIAIALASCSGSKNGGFELKGTLTNSAGETLVLEQMSQKGATVIDSVQIDEKGNFKFEHARLPQMDFYRLKITDANFAIIVADSTQQLNFTGDAKQLGKAYTVEGSPDTKHFINLNTVLQKSNAAFDSLKTAFSAVMMSLQMDSLKMDSLNNVAEKAYMEIIERGTPELIKKVESFPGTIANFSAFNYINIEKYLPVYEKVSVALQDKYPASFYTKELKTNLENYKKQFELKESQNKAMPTGAAMPDIQLNNPDGKLIALSSFKGKIVLVDFWASWCGPCRRENPNVVRVYNKFHSKGFEVYGVSLDEEKDKWVKAIEKDGLPWTHVSDLGGWQSSVCATFNITAIPFTILVDRKGNIAAKGLRGEELEKKVEELLSN